jgi:phosphoribosylanthranilate isomerase
LHGEESPELAKVLGGRVIKAVRAQNESDIARLLRFPAEAFLIDGKGDGQTADWKLARTAAQGSRVLLAGGLNAGNLREAVSLVRPAGVDLSSGLEIRPGVKDPGKLREFFAEVRRCEGDLKL